MLCIKTVCTQVKKINTGVRKKIEALAKQKDCKIVGERQKSILNHQYWCVASSPSGDSDLVQAKWLSIENHIHNVHRGHSKAFPKCTHPSLRASERNKKWFKRHKYHSFICLHNGVLTCQYTK